MAINLSLAHVVDPAAKRAHQETQDTLNLVPLIVGNFHLFSLTETAAVGNTLYHGLGFTPTDIIITSGHGKVTFDFTTATDTSINYTTTGAVTARILLGRI